MNRDPLFEQIIRRLGEISDGPLFEACVTDLLRTEWPNLIPVPGGNDAGVDGAWANERGKGLLIVTTGQSVLANVTKSLRQHLKTGGDRRQVLVATSKKLSPQRCRNIESRIKKLGFESAHYPYTQQAIADRLYHNSRWLKELLGLSGMASSLSRVPRFIRPLRDLPLVGREADLDWLRTTPRDRLLFGQPGVGKTFLCQAFVNEGRGLFAIDDDSVRLAEAIREQRPTAIIVEDAHLRLHTIEALRRYREETRTDFDLIADSWPGGFDSVSGTMCLSESHCRHIQRVPGDSIVALANAAGIHGPNWLLHMIVRQSAGCPGRAAMLIYFSLTSSNLREVFFGRTLATWVRTTFAQLVSERAWRMLAAFAIGGDEGISIKLVSQVLGYPVGDIQVDMTQLALGGVVHQINDGSLSVLPEPLRCELVCDYFFKQPIPLDLEPFLTHPNDRGAVCETLIGAQQRGASIPTELLFEQLELSNDMAAWEYFAWTEESNARLVIERHPRHLIALAGPFLQFIPELTIPKLLEQSIGDDRKLNSHPSHPLRLLQAWISSAEPGTAEPVRRRRILWSALQHWIDTRPDPDVALRALPIVVAPAFETNEQKAGSGKEYMMRFGTVTHEELKQIAELWSDILGVLARIHIVDWNPVFEAVDQWVYPGRVRVVLPAEQYVTFEVAVSHILPALARIAKKRAGILSRHSKTELSNVDIDSDFARLFPDDPFDAGDDREQRTREQQDDVLELAREWLDTPPADVSRKLVWCIREASHDPHPWPDYSIHVCNVIARETPADIPYLDAFLADDAPPDVVHAFLEQAAQKHEAKWFERAMVCLGSEKYLGAGLSVLLSHAQPFSENIEVEIIDGARRVPGIVENLCFFAKIALARLRRLLGDDDERLLSATATGMWNGRTTAPIPLELLDLWRQAILRVHVQDYRLSGMFEHDAELAFLWLRDRAARTSARPMFSDNLFVAAAKSLASARRREILQSLSPKVLDAERIVRAVIGGDLNLYREFLADSSRKALHLSPLHRAPDARWAEWAMIALDNGFSPQELAGTAFDGPHIFRGSIHERYEERAQHWTLLSHHADPRIQEIARIGADQCHTTAEEFRKSDEMREFLETYG